MLCSIDQAGEIRLLGIVIRMMIDGPTREVRELLVAGGPPEPAKMAGVMMRHGLVPAKPASSRS
jgi:hypothetical protein